MNTPHSFPDALIVIALAALFGFFLYMRHKERQRRLEIVHQERLAAMDKGVPLPELPAEPAKQPHDHRAVLLHGVAWVTLAGGGAIALRVTRLNINGVDLWPLTIPLLLLGVGLILTYGLAYRTR